MLLGMPTLIEKRNIEGNFKLAKELNLDFIELNLDLPYCKLISSNFNSSVINNMKFSAHLPENWDVGVLNLDYRKFILSQIEKTIKSGTSIANITKYTLHLNLGVYFTLPTQKKYIYEEYLKDYSNAFNDSCYFLNELAEKYNVILLFENLKINNSIKQAISIISKYPNLFFTWDIGHDAKCGSNLEQLPEFSSKIRHIHLHDYNGISDHLALGTGIVDIKNRLSFVKDKPIDVVIETKTEKALRASLAYLTSKLYNPA